MSDAKSAISELDFGPLPNMVGYRLRKAQIAAYHSFMSGEPEPGLTPGQFSVLVLIKHNESLTQQQLSDGIGVDKSTLVATLDRLTMRGLIKRARSTVDRRQNELKLTPKGMSTLKAMIEFVNEHEKRLMARLSFAERAMLLDLLRKIG